MNEPGNPVQPDPHQTMSDGVPSKNKPSTSPVVPPDQYSHGQGPPAGEKGSQGDTCPDTAGSLPESATSTDPFHTLASVWVPPPREELIDFLAPGQQPDELGRLGTYRILKVLGAGGMGVVFHAEDLQLQREVALKAMLPALAASGGARLRFLREA